MIPPAVEVQNIRKVFVKKERRKSTFARIKRSKAVALDGVSFSVKRGEIFGILGPNGSGKSTLIRLLSTLLLPDSGTIHVFGHDVLREEFAVKQLINRVSVDAAFFKKFSPIENLSYAARLYGMPIGEARCKMREIMLRLGLKEETFTSPME